MRNLKKILALVLAMVMTFSVMATANAFTDDADIDADYAEAVEVLAGLGVLKGYEEADDEYSIKPQNSITRAEVAAMIYRIATGDVDDKQDDLYAGAAQFTDAIPTWAAGYIGYCANAGYIKGYEDGSFRPQGNVTGFEALVMILRAVGYGEMNEFTGAEWKTNAASVAKQLHITDNVTPGLLVAAASREVVAEILFQAIYLAPQVTFTPALGYNQYTTVLGLKKELNDTIGEETFGLVKAAVERDTWGRPFYKWTANKNPNKARTVATIEYAPLAAYTTPVAECDIAADLGLTSNTKVAALTINGYDVAVNTYDKDGKVVLGDQDVELYFNNNDEINTLATKATVGEQGRLTEIYKTADGYEVVMIDEFLAVVTDVTELEYDRNGHLSQTADLTLWIYDEAGSNVKNGTEITLTSSKKNWNYSVDDMVLVNAVTEDHADNSKVYTESLVDDDLDEVVIILGLAESMDGAQTAYTTNPVHIIEDVEYPDAIQFDLDQAKNDTADYTWYFDSYGNLIGAFEIATKYSYGTITEIKWVENNTSMENGYALATITYMDGTPSTEKVYSIQEINDAKAQVLSGVEGKQANYADGQVSSTKQYNESGVKATGDVTTDYTNVALYQISTSSKGLVLKEVAKLDAEASVETGVPNIDPIGNDYYVNAGKTTMFLVWNGKTYETYTGIQNVPSYKAGVAGTYWAAKVDMEADVKDTTAEYVFINNADLVDAEKTVTFYANSDDTLTVKTHLKSAGGISYYSITGGYVNGEAETVYVLVGAETYYTDNAAVMEILNNKGNLLTLDLTDEKVETAADVNVVTEVAEELNDDEIYVVYAGAAKDATLNDGVLVANGEEYYVDEAATISYYNKTLKHAVSNKYGYLYIAYTLGAKDTKNAQIVYISDADLTTVTFVDGDGVVVDTVAVLVGEAAATTAIPEKTEDDTNTYAFDGKWYTDATCTTEADLTAVKGDMTVYAGFIPTAKAETFTVTFVNDDNTVLAEVPVKEGEVIAAEDIPTATKDADAQYTYTFDAWDQDLTAVVTGDMTVKASYTSTVNEYTVTITAATGITADKATQDVAYGTAFEVIFTADAGYTLTTVTGADTFDVSTGKATVTVTDDVTIEAAATANEYKVTFKNGVDNTTIGTDMIAYNSAYALPEAPEVTGYSFQGWNTKANGTGTVVTAETVFTSTKAVTVYAYYEADLTVTNSSGVTVTVNNAEVLKSKTATVAYGEEMEVVCIGTRLKITGATEELAVDEATGKIVYTYTVVPTANVTISKY